MASPPRSSLDEWYPALLGQPFVLFLGRVHEKKGVPALIASFADPALAGRRLALVVAGPVDDDYRSTLDRILAAMPDRHRLLLTGPVSGARKAALLAHATAFVLPSLSEGLPMAALEALASGCPTILTAACNLPEVAASGAGIEVLPDPRQIAGAIARLVSDPALRSEMGARGRTLASGRFDSQAVGERMLSLCQDLAART